MLEPDVSVLVAAHNARSTINECLQSVLNQSHNNWECLVLDDGSEDETGELARNFARQDSRIKVFEQTRQSGPAVARNNLLKEASGRFIAVFDADDKMHQDRLSLQVAYLDDAANQSISAVGSHVHYFSESPILQGRIEYENWLNSMCSWEDISRDAFIEMPIGHPTLLFRRKVLEQLGGWRNELWPEDWDLFLRMVIAGHKIGVIQKELLSWRLDDGSFSMKSNNYSVEAFVKCRANFIASSFLATSREYVLWGYGSTGRNLRRTLATHGKRVSQVVELNPKKIGNNIHGAKVVSPEDLDNPLKNLLLVSVAGTIARTKIRKYLTQRNYQEGIDFIVVA